MQGNLTDMGVADLIQHACQDGKRARLWLERDGRQAEIYFQSGQVTHAACGELTGEPALFALLEWDDGQFRLDRRSRGGRAHDRAKLHRAAA